ncbi:WSC-domain-containing protein [Cadophora sp. DSE1049]|nr:WSC-domain-containing protein [Cadophora sp. DSE1049]
MKFPVILLAAWAACPPLYVLAIHPTDSLMDEDLSLEGEIPFKVADLNQCNDVGQYVGIIGTPIIDPETDTVYFWAKSYLDGGQTGWINGAYRFHAIDAVTLAERPGFPTNIQGITADNDPTRMFHGGIHMQRPALNIVNGVIFAGFGSHCDMYNYTGWVVGMSTEGKFLSAYSTAAGPGSRLQDGTWTGGGGAAGIWMGGAALASDNSGRLFFATGNGRSGGVNQALPSSGRTCLSTLSECMVNLAVGANGSLTQQDYFEPATYLSMDGGDRDLGSGGVVLPDPSVFSGGGVNRLAISCGKNGQCFVANADNLGGYKMASGGDALVQTLTPPGGGAIFANTGTYPLEGGFLYVTPVGNPTYVYSLGFDTNGRPSFTLVAQTDENTAGSVGTGPPTITTYDNQPGTAMLWIMDTNGVRAYYAVPVNGKMVRIPISAAYGMTKFSRVSFGNGRYYVTGFNGAIMGYGAPVAVPLNCTSPVEFRAVAIGTAKTMTISCTALIAITKIQGLTIGKTMYTALNSSLPQGALAAGATFSFPVTFNLSSYVLTGGSTSSPTVSPGVLSSAMFIYTKNAITGYSSQQSIGLTGTIVSPNPWLSISPLQVTFNGIVIGSSASEGGSSTTFIIQNTGQAEMTILGYAFSMDSTSTVYTNVTMGTPTNLDANGYFTAQSLPAVGAVFNPGESLTVGITFDTTDTGSFFSILTVFTTGGTRYIILAGTASTVPVALLEQSTNEGGWISIPNCPIPSEGCTTQVDIGTLSTAGTILQTVRFTNNGGSNLEITKSKPPEGVILGAANPNTDFSEGLTIAPGNNLSAVVYFKPNSGALNADPTVYSAAWTLNTNDLTWGVHVVNFTGTLAPARVGPLLPDVADLKCANYACAGDPTQWCGGNGGFLALYYDSLNFDPVTRQMIGSTISSISTSTSSTSSISSSASVSSGSTSSLISLPSSTLTSTTHMPTLSSSSTSPALFTSSTTSLSSSSASSSFSSSSSVSSQGSVSSTATPTISSSNLSSKSSSSTSTTATPTSTSPSIPPVIGSYTYKECRSDNTTIRTLVGKKKSSTKDMTLEFCMGNCTGYNYFGVEYGAECYCGNALSFGSFAASDGRCKMLCPGNKMEICGGSSGLTLYQLTVNVISSIVSSSSTSAQSTISSESTSVSTQITSATSVETSTDSESSESSLSTSTSSTTQVSSSRGSSSSSLTSSVEATSHSSSVSSSSSSSSSVSEPTSTSASMEPLETTASTNTILETISSSVTVSSTSSSAPTVSPTSPAQTWAYAGCANDTTATRALTGVLLYNSTMDASTCQRYCFQKHYALAGHENGNQCFCGLALSNGATLGRTGCTVPCIGNPSEICGGSSRLSIYNQTDFDYPEFVQNAGAYSLQGCLVDGTGTGRILQGYTTTLNSAMTIEKCITTCAAKGYTKAGVEFGTQCYCDNSVTSTTLAPIGDCSKIFCSGNATQFCGAASRMLLYST